MNEAGGYDGIWFAYKKEADKSGQASGSVRLGIFTFSTHHVACSHRAAYSFNIVRAASATCAFSPKKKTHPDGDGPRWVRVGGWMAAVWLRPQGTASLHAAAHNVEQLGCNGLLTRFVIHEREFA